MYYRERKKCPNSVKNRPHDTDHPNDFWEGHNDFGTKCVKSGLNLELS
jgi:hypothetical protein